MTEDLHGLVYLCMRVSLYMLRCVRLRLRLRVPRAGGELATYAGSVRGCATYGGGARGSAICGRSTRVHATYAEDVGEYINVWQKW